jgi:hypothetical protein
MVVRWRTRYGTQGEGCALSPAHAKALAQAFQSLYPRDVYWVEPPAAFASGPGATPTRHPRPR